MFRVESLYIHNIDVYSIGILYHKSNEMVLKSHATY